MGLFEAVIFIVLALFLYSLGLWQSRRYNYFLSVALFMGGLAFDLKATWIVYEFPVQEYGSVANWLAVICIGALVVCGMIGIWLQNSFFLDWFKKLVPWACLIRLASLIIGTFFFFYQLERF